jgi:hypothetical protein
MQDMGSNPGTRYRGRGEVLMLPVFIFAKMRKISGVFHAVYIIWGNSF